jgi:hypothetical protein
MSKSAEGVVEWARTWRGKTRRLIEITNVKWDKEEVRRGDVLKLTADVKGARDGTEAQIEIWEHDADGAHDFIDRFSSQVKNEKVETEWEFEYHGDTDEIPTAEESEKGYNPPEYFFRVKVGENFEDSGLILFKDSIEFQLVDEDGNPIGGQKYILHLPDGSKREGVLDDNGYASMQDVPPGKYNVVYPDVFPKTEVETVEEEDLPLGEQENVEEDVNYMDEQIMDEEEEETIDYFGEEEGEEEEMEQKR